MLQHWLIFLLVIRRHRVSVTTMWPCQLLGLLLLLSPSSWALPPRGRASSAPARSRGPGSSTRQSSCCSTSSESTIDDNVPSGCQTPEAWLQYDGFPQMMPGECPQTEMYVYDSQMTMPEHHLPMMSLPPQMLEDDDYHDPEAAPSQEPVSGSGGDQGPGPWQDRYLVMMLMDPRMMQLFNGGVCAEGNAVHTAPDGWQPYSPQMWDAAGDHNAEAASSSTASGSGQPSSSNNGHLNVGVHAQGNAAHTAPDGWQPYSPQMWDAAGDQNAEAASSSTASGSGQPSSSNNGHLNVGVHAQGNAAMPTSPGHCSSAASTDPHGSAQAGWGASGSEVSLVMSVLPDGSPGVSQVASPPWQGGMWPKPQEPHKNAPLREWNAFWKALREYNRDLRQRRDWADQSLEL